MKGDGIEHGRREGDRTGLLVSGVEHRRIHRCIWVPASASPRCACSNSAFLDGDLRRGVDRPSTEVEEKNFLRSSRLSAEVEHDGWVGGANDSWGFAEAGNLAYIPACLEREVLEIGWNGDDGVHIVRV